MRIWDRGHESAGHWRSSLDLVVSGMSGDGSNNIDVVPLHKLPVYQGWLASVTSRVRMTEATCDTKMEEAYESKLLAASQDQPTGRCLPIEGDWTVESHERQRDRILMSSNHILDLKS